MKKLSKREYLIWFIIGAAGLVLFLLYQPKVVPLSKVQVSIGRNEAAQIAEEYLESQGFDLSELDGLYRSIRFLPSHVQERAYQILNFSEKDYNFLEEHSPAYYWVIGWYNDAGRQVYSAFISPDGVPFGFEHYIPEDI